MAQLLREKEGHLLTLTLNRPEKKNATSAEILCGLADGWRQLDDDDELRVAILTGVGDVFCAGMDLSLIPRLSTGQTENEYEERLLKESNLSLDAYLKTYRPTKPVICAVEGYALAGGTEILQGTDIRVAAKGASFGITEVQRSLFPMAGSSVRLPRQIPYTVAVEMLLTGDAISASRAYELGLVGHVVPDSQALTKAREIAARIALNGPLAVKAILASIRQTEALPEAQAFEIEGPIGAKVFTSKDAIEGPRAFIEKRKPVWTGR